MTTSELPGVLRWAVRLLWAEAGLAGLLVILLGYQGAVATPASLADALALAGFVALLAAALAGLAAALARRKPRARAPAIVLQLLAVMFAYVLVNAGLWLIAVPLGLLGLAVATLLFAPGTGEALG